ETVPGHELVVDPNAQGPGGMRRAKWCVRTKNMTDEAIWEEWGVVPEGAEGSRTISDEVYSLMDESYHPGANTKAVHRFWTVPCRAAPRGLVVTWAGKTILEDPKPFPYNHGRLPYIEWDLLPGLGRREGRTWVD